TILVKRVGRSVVSAITQTPASRPLRPATTPPISAAPILTPGALFAAALAPAGANAAAITAAAPAPNCRCLRLLKDIAAPHRRGSDGSVYADGAAAQHSAMIGKCPRSCARSRPAGLSSPASPGARLL